MKFLRDSIFEAAAFDEAFSSVAAAISSSVGASSGWVQEAGPAIGARIDSAYNFDFATLARYAEEGRYIDPWVEAGLRLPEATALNMARFVPAAHYERSDFYQAIARPHGDYFHCLGLWVKTADGVMIVGLQRTRAEAAFNEDGEVALQRATRALTHLGIVRARRRADAQVKATLSSALEHLGDMVMVLDGSGAVVFATDACEGFLRESGILARSPDGRLCSQHLDVQQLLAAARHSGRASARVGGCELEAKTETCAAGYCLFQIHQPAAAATSRAKRAQLAFDLSLAETGVLAGLLEGLTPEQCAARRGVSLPTIRSQIRSIFAKTQTRRIAELLTSTRF